MEHRIVDIKQRLAINAYQDEAAVSHGIVVPILQALGWDAADPSQIVPQYKTEGKRVDYALWGRGTQPSVFIEVKRVGRHTSGKRQLFEYAFHQGTPICVLTDGQEWSFYLPSGQGSYDERRFSWLHLIEHDAAECCEVLLKYLGRSRLVTGEAIDAAKQDHHDLSSRREAERNIPTAWRRLLSQEGELLVEMLSNQTKTVSGISPKNEDVWRFLHDLSPLAADHETEASRISSSPASENLQAPRQSRDGDVPGKALAAPDSGRANRAFDRQPIWRLFLTTLLGKSVRSRRSGQPISIWRLLMIAADREFDAQARKEATLSLAEVGLRVLDEIDEDRKLSRWLAVANRHTGLSSLLAQEVWGHASKWQKILQGMLGTVPGRPMRFAGSTSRSVKVPLTAVLEVGKSFGRTFRGPNTPK